MTDIIIKLLEASVWSGMAAVWFGILFNIPKNTIYTVFLLGAGAGFIKFLLIHLNIHVVPATFLASFFVGIVGIPLAHKIHQTPVVFSIPPVIPMIPGFFAYKTVVSVMNFLFIVEDPDKRLLLIDSIFTNGFTMLFVLISITVGAGLPMLMLRKDTVKRLDE